MTGVLMADARVGDVASWHPVIGYARASGHESAAVADADNTGAIARPASVGNAHNTQRAML